MSFSQLPAVEKNTENGATGKFLGPSYFETALVSLENSVSSHESLVLIQTLDF